MVEKELKKVLKIKIGEVYINEDIGKKSVYIDAWETEVKEGKNKGDKYFVANLPMFLNEVKVDKKED